MGPSPHNVGEKWGVVTSITSLAEKCKHSSYKPAAVLRTNTPTYNASPNLTMVRSKYDDVAEHAAAL